MVDLADVAEAAAVVLTEPGHLGATNELVGPEALSQTEIAAILSRQLGRPVRAEVIPLDAWERNARSSGMGEYQVTTLLKMFRYYEQHGFWGNPNVLSWLLGRPATRFEDFVARTMRGKDAVLSSTTTCHVSTICVRRSVRLVADLPAEALNWRPIEASDDHAMNSLAVLAAHVAGAEHFWITEIIGGRPATRDRDAEFVTVAAGAAGLCQRLDAVADETRPGLR